MHEYMHVIIRVLYWAKMRQTVIPKYISLSWALTLVTPMLFKIIWACSTQVTALPATTTVAQLMCGMGESSLSRQRLANGLTTPAAFLLRMLLMQLINSFCLLTAKIYFYNISWYRWSWWQAVQHQESPTASRHNIVEMSAQYLEVGMTIRCRLRWTSGERLMNVWWTVYWNTNITIR